MNLHYIYTFLVKNGPNSNKVGTSHNLPLNPQNFRLFNFVLMNNDEMIEVALTRIDKNNVSGYGPIAYIIGITDNIAGLEIDSEVEIIRVKALDKEEEQVKLGQRSTSFTIIGKEDGNVGGDMNGIFSLYPNPTSDWVSVVSRHGFEPEGMTLVDMNGKIIDVPQDSNRVSLESVPAGTYILRIKSGKTQVHKFIVRQ